MSDERGPFMDADRLECTLGVLASQRRLYALVALRQRETPLSLSSLAEEVAARELGTDPAVVPSESLTRVHDSLYHAHVPKLEDAGVVEFDSTSMTVDLAENVDHVETVVDAVFDA